MHPADFAGTVGAFTVELTHMLVPVKSLVAVETLTTVTEDTINNTHHSNDFDRFFFFFFDLTMSLHTTAGARHDLKSRVEGTSCCWK